MTLPLGPGSRAVEVGGQHRSALLRSLQASGVLLNDYARTLMHHHVFDDGSTAQVVDVVELTLLELGLPQGGTLSDVITAARDQGLEACPAITGPYLRLATLDQPAAPDSVLSAGRPPTGALHVVSEPLSHDDAYPKGFYLRVVDDRPWLRGYRCDATYAWGPGDLLALVRP